MASTSGTKNEHGEQFENEALEDEVVDGASIEQLDSETDSEWDSLSDYPDTSSEESDTEVIDKTKIESKIIFGEVGELEGEVCICKSVNSKIEALCLMSILVDTTPTFNNINCIVDNIIRCYNLIYLSGKISAKSPIKNACNSSKIAFADLFYRIRHEVLFKLLCLSFNLPVQHSDISFREFGIDSDRTPDLIIEEDDVLKIIEVTAVSSIEKASQNKGYEQMGFESKYKREIDLLTDCGKTCVFLPVFFDMSGSNNNVNKEQLAVMKAHFPRVNDSYKKLMEIASSQLGIMTNNFKNSLILPSAVLFSDITPIKSNHSTLDFLYRKSREPTQCNYYKELTVSTYVYNKIINERDRFYWMLDNTKHTSNVKLLFMLNTLNHRITLEPNQHGKEAEELRQFLIDNDVINILKFSRVKVGNNVLPTTDSETGVKFYEKTKKEAWFEQKLNEIPLIANHNCTALDRRDFNIDKYKERMAAFKSNNYHSLHYDPNYEETIINSIINFDLTRNENYDVDEFPNLLGNLKSNEIDIDEVMENVHSSYLDRNRFNLDTLPIRRPKMKQPFILPIANLNESSYCPLDNKNINFIDRLQSAISMENPYTALILRSTMEDRYKMYTKSKAASITLNNLIKQRYKVSNDLNSLQKELNKAGEGLRLSKTKNEKYLGPYNSLVGQYRSINKEIQNRKRSEGVGSDISFIRLPTKSKGGHLRKMYELEMDHFKDRRKQSTIEGVGLMNNIRSDYDSDLKIFQSLSALMCEDRGDNPDKVIDEYVADDACLIRDLKQQAIDNYKKLMNEVRRSYLGHSAAMVSRLAHSLMFYSQLPFSSDYIRVDNLGYKNVLLIVKGGKKIFKSKSSKLYRLVYPISEELIPWYQQGHIDKGSFTLVNINDVHYGITPWSFMHESVLTDSISFYSRVSSFTFLNLDPNLDLKSQFNKVYLNVLLGFHNRRQTEVMLANMRYILLSTLGDFTGVSQILTEFFDFNYDRFQGFIRNSLLLNYPTYFKTLQKMKDMRSGFGKDVSISDFVDARLRNIFTLEVVTKVEDLALMIYSTFLMTKAPYQKVAERSRNLRGILGIHEQFDREVGLKWKPEEQTKIISVENKGDFVKYTDDLFKSDFNFDPKFCALVGNFVNSIFINNKDTEDIETSWIRIMNEPWDEMATSTGLRGDYAELDDFWGQKGYFVVYKSLLSEPGFSDSLKMVFHQDLDDDKKRKLIRGMNEMFHEKFNPDREFLIFHAVDKVQWRGGREIYVMDLMTKTLQQPIEKFMAVLCKKLDNELISIPSDRRAQVIHHAIFERDLPLKDTLTWYLTLDCSKWAPKSVFVKFVVMLLNMSVIPNTFKTHFMNYIEKLYCKRIYFNTSEVMALKNNVNYRELVDKYLIEDKHVKGYYLEMPYSWVMGIFNYTSSFLHAANQKYFSYLLMKTSLISYKEETSLVMFAHSDDSGGRLTASGHYLAKRALILYEVFLKSCNHLLSKKKSVVSRVYFEILSVIYIFKKLLALLPKFLGGLRFLPTDKGPAQDMLQSYSKAIEVMIAGSDFSISYIVLKVYSYMVWRFYYNKQPSVSDYDRPVQYLGLPDAHPLFVLLCGSDADILRLMKTGRNLVDIITFVNTMSKQMDGEGPIKPLKFEIKVKGIKKGFEDFIDCFKEELQSWSIRNVNYHNTGLNTLSFLRKLNDSGFVGSLVNESTVRRISRCYFIRSGDSAITRLGNVKLSVLMDAINLSQSFRSKESEVRHLLHDVFDVESIDMIDKEFEQNRPGSVRMVNLLSETLKSPLRIYKYLDLLSLKDRKINISYRTLKPTQVQLVKSARVFSNKFDPASLVSYMKEEGLRWALPSVRGILTAQNEVERFLTDIGYNVSEVDPDMLLRVCRTYGVDNTKNIYLYSRVPSDIKQIKTYAAFLTFLSVNSFQNKEILGLTLKLTDKEMDKEYVQPHITEEVYLVNNAVSLIVVLIEKCGIEFTQGLKIKDLLEIGWSGGGVIGFIEHVESLYDTDVRYTLLRAQIHYLKFKLGLCTANTSFLNNSAFYTFLKSQKSRGGWVGKGELYIKIDNNFYSFVLENSDIVSLFSNKTGKIPYHHVEFIFDVLNQCNINVKSMKRPKYTMFNDLHFGYDNSNDVSILSGRELNIGVPCVTLSMRNDYVDNLDYFEMVDYKNSHLVIKSGFERDYIYKKIHLLPIKKAELVGTIKSMLDPADFEDNIINQGVSNFEEFIYTEILTEYGREVYIDFNELFDNFAASRIYGIFKVSHEKSYSSIPKTVSFSPLPASEGSLVRILIDYSRVSGDNVINVPLNLDPTMMQIRSEYPEQMATVLGEQLEKYHRQIYTLAERKEITDNYDLISKEQDINKRRAGIIKLMSFWGYGSLVHNIKTFTLSRSVENYSYFNSGNLLLTGGAIYADLFEFITKEINIMIKKWRPMFNSLEPPLYNLFKISNWDTVVEDYMYSVVMSVYNYKSLGIRLHLYQLNYMNTLIACMQEEEFIAELQENLKKNYIIDSIPISWQNRHDLISTINVLRVVWTKQHKVDFNLNYISKLQRFPDRVQNYKGLLRNFDVNLRGRDTNYHGFLNNDLISYIYSLSEVSDGGIKYRISSKITQMSDIEVYMNEAMQHIRPISGEILDDQLWEDLNYELSMPEVDVDEVEAIRQDMPEDIYKPSTVRKFKVKGESIINATVHWIICPNCDSTDNPLPNFRQVGENIVVVTNVILNRFRSVFPNSGVRVLNPTKILKDENKTLLLYYSLHKSLCNKGFLDKFLKGSSFELLDSDYERVKANWVRNEFGVVCDPRFQGLEDANSVIIGETTIHHGDGKLIMVNEKDKKEQKNDENVDDADRISLELYDSFEEREVKKLEKIKLTIKAIEDENIISEDSLKTIKNKYMNKSIKHGIPMSVILRSILEETELLKINSGTLSNDLGISANDQKKMFLSPGYFALGRGVNKMTINPIKDKKLRSELNSFHPDLATSIGSNTLKLSKKFSKLIMANIKFWILTIKNSKVKTDNKKFLLNLFISICNNVILSEDEEDDQMWQQIVNKTSLYMSDDDEDGDDDEFFNMVFSILPASRIRYRSEGT